MKMLPKALLALTLAGCGKESPPPCDATPIAPVAEIKNVQVDAHKLMTKISTPVDLETSTTDTEAADIEAKLTSKEKELARLATGIADRLSQRCNLQDRAARITVKTPKGKTYQVHVMDGGGIRNDLNSATNDIEIVLFKRNLGDGITIPLSMLGATLLSYDGRDEGLSSHDDVGFMFDRKATFTTGEHEKANPKLAKRASQSDTWTDFYFGGQGVGWTTSDQDANSLAPLFQDFGFLTSMPGDEKLQKILEALQTRVNEPSVPVTYYLGQGQTEDGYFTSVESR